MDKNGFIEECRFAKNVTNSDGEPCILINGLVFQLNGTLGASYTEFFVAALRSASIVESSVTGMASTDFSDATMKAQN